MKVLPLVWRGNNVSLLVVNIDMVKRYILKKMGLIITLGLEGE